MQGEQLFCLGDGKLLEMQPNSLLVGYKAWLAWECGGADDA